MKNSRQHHAREYKTGTNIHIRKRLIIYISIVVLAFTIGCIGVYGFGHRPEEEQASPPPDTKPAPTPDIISPPPDTRNNTEPDAETDMHADPGYFKNALFIGNSRTEGFQLYSGPHEATYYTSQGLNVNTIYEKAIVGNGSDGKITAIDALRKQRFNTIYIMLGTNELGWAYSSIFIERYGVLIDELKALQPDAVIYVESILPVTKAESDASDIYNMGHINEYNALIRRMAEDKDIKYLNVAECVTNADGYLYDDAATDGIHLTKEYCDKWLAYIVDEIEGQKDEE